MRSVKVLLAIALMLVLSAAVSQAAFDNSHHDMRGYIAGAEGCAPCHGVIDSSVPGSVNDNSVGSIGALCMARCHVGGAGLPAGAANAQMTPATGPGLATQTDYTTAITSGITITYFDQSHGRNPANLDNPNFTTAPVAAWPPGGTANTWPYVAAATNLQCTSCHAVHDNKNAPFLWAPLAAGGANGVDGFCDLCHVQSGRRGVVSATPSGNHVINVAADNTATGAAGRTGNTRHPRRIVIQQYGAGGTTPIFDVPVAAGNLLTGTTNPATAWNSGGHVITPAAQTVQSSTAIASWTSGASTQSVGCFTCHSAHRTPSQGTNNLAVLPVFNSTTPTSITYNPICTGCHGLSTTPAGDASAFDVGTTAWGHPVGANTASTLGVYTSSVGNITFAVATPTWTNVQNGNQWGASGRVLCTSCHKVHGGDRMALANLGQAAGSTAICKECHAGTGIPNLNDTSKGNANLTTGQNAPNTHHVTRGTSMTLPGAITATGEAGQLFIQNPSWGGGTTPNGTLGDITGSMDCADCHIFNSTAHNW